MKIFTFHFALAMIYLATSMPAQAEKTTNLMEIIEAILNDPEFVALRPEFQLRVLLIIYDMLEKQNLSKFKTQQDIKR